MGHINFKLLGMLCAIAFAMLLGAVVVDKAADSVSGEALWSRRQCVIIDPGHGGEDGGAISCTGRRESDLNLDISLRLRDLLNFLGIRVYMIRTTDVSVYTYGSSLAQKKISDLKERVNVIQSTPHSLVLSIHQNSFPDGKYYGPQVFYGNTASIEAAKTLQKILNENVRPESNRNAKKVSGVYLMEKIDSVALLTECGFLSNPEEETLLYSKEHQLKICCAMASFCSEYLKNVKIA